MTSGYIDDGYTLDAYVRELPGIHAALRFSFRPVTAADRARTFENWDCLPESERLARITTRLAANVHRWDLVDAQGRPVSPHEQESYARLCGPLYRRLQEIVFQAEAGDPDPQKPSNEESTRQGYEDASAEGN